MKMTILFLFFCIATFGQDQKAKLMFIDGTTWDGYAEIAGRGKVKFRFDLEEKPSVWGPDELLGVELYDYDKTLLFEYVKLPNQSWRTLVETVTEGEITLYYFSEETFVLPGGVDFGTQMNNGQPVGIRTSANAVPLKSKQDRMYLLRLSTGEITKVPTSVFQNWAKQMAAYFKDCPAVVKRIQDHTFGADTIKEMVEYYNDFCVSED